MSAMPVAEATTPEALQVSLDDYLKMSFEYDAEYVDGEIVERAMPDNFHSRTVYQLIKILVPLVDSKGLAARPDIRLRLSPKKVRIPDISLFREDPTEDYPSSPPLVAVEVVSAGDAFSRLLGKLEEYREWGAENIWVVEPRAQKFFVFDDESYRSAPRFELPEFDFAIEPADLFD